jgi:hypothetical protein
MMLVICGATALANQQCDTKSYPLSTPTERFHRQRRRHVDGYPIRHDVDALRAGTNWTGSRCSGKPQRTDLEIGAGGRERPQCRGRLCKHNDWRMPHIPELAMIVERQCANPRVNLALFPDTPATYFWTATGRRGPGQEGPSLSPQLRTRRAGPDRKDNLHYARLVRADK